MKTKHDYWINRKLDHCPMASLQSPDKKKQDC